MIDVNHEKNTALIIEATGKYSRNRGRETPIWEAVINRDTAFDQRGEGFTRFNAGILEYNAAADCPQHPFLYCQNLDNSLGVHKLTNDHPHEYISINCVATGIGSGLSGISPATGNFDSGNSNNSTFYVSGSGICPTCDNGKWLTDTSPPFGPFYTESECRVYYGCTGHSFLDPLETSFQEVCPSGVSGIEDLKLNEKLLISYLLFFVLYLIFHTALFHLLIEF